MGKLTICSDMSGQLLLDGRPVGDVTLTRAWTWPMGEKTGTDEAVTDADGRFRFGAVEARKTLFSRLPHEPNIRQIFTIDRNGRPVRVAIVFRRGYVNGQSDEFRIEKIDGVQLLIDQNDALGEDD